MKCCHSEENHHRPYRSHLGCWSVGCGRFSGVDPDSGLCCCPFTSSFISQVPSHVLHGQAALVPLSLPTWEDSWVAHQHTDVSLFRPSMTPIVGPSVTRAFIWDASVWSKEKKKKMKAMLTSFSGVDTVISQHKCILISFMHLSRGRKHWVWDVYLKLNWIWTEKLDIKKIKRTSWILLFR